MKNKLTLAALIVLGVGALAVFVPSLFWHTYTDGVVRAWRDTELKMTLDTMRIIVGIGSGISLVGMVLLVIARFKEFRLSDGMGLAFIGLSVITVLGFLTEFYPCLQMMPSQRPMSCYNTMHALLGILAAVGVLGFLMLTNRNSKDINKGISFGITALSVTALLIPTVLVTACFGTTMDCHDKFEPFAIAMTCLLTVVAVVNTVMVCMRKDRQ